MKKLGLLALMIFAPTALMAETICAIVKIEIRQELSLERQAFDAKMVINNGLDVASLENLGINVTFEDVDGNPVLASSDPDNISASFFITVDRMDGVNSIDGSGVINAGDSAEIHWLIIPAPGAGGNTPIGLRYGVGASVSYTFGEESQEISVTPDFIQVRPTPLLTLDYFIPQDVFGDDPLTPQTEAIEPFDLGLRIKNSGYGDAIDLKIESAQPEIIENEQGLLIDFALLGSEVNDSEVSTSLLADVGLLPGGDSAMVSWLMSTSLNGEFISFTADFVHSDEYGGALTSLIDSVNTHYLAHRVLVDLPGRDTISDFLAIDGSQYRVYESNGGQGDVIEQSGSLTNGGVIGGNQQYSLDFNATAGPVYTQVTDPYQGVKQEITAVRSDGKVLPYQNVWQFKIETNPGEYEYYIAVFDTNSGGEYTLIINGAEPNVAPVISVTDPQAALVNELLEFDIDVTDTNNGDVLTLVMISGPPQASVGFVSGSTWRFTWLPDTPGMQQIVLRASDGQLNSDETVTIEIDEGDQSDTDGDGMLDDWEQMHFGDLDETAEGDFDQDSATNKQEHDHGGNPTVEDRPQTPEWVQPLGGAVVTTVPSNWVVSNAVAAVDADVVYQFEIHETNVSNTPLASFEAVEMAVQTSWEHGISWQENTNYILRVRAYDGVTPSWWAYDSFIFDASNEAPEACGLAIPYQSVIKDLRPVLSVFSATDIDTESLNYQFKIYSDQAGMDLVIDSGWVSDEVLGGSDALIKSWLVHTGLQDLTVYYWQVMATDGMTEISCGTGSFQTDASSNAPRGYETMSPVNVLTDVNNLTLAAYQVDLPMSHTWTYEMELDQVLSFNSNDLIGVDSLTVDSNDLITWQLAGSLNEDTRYYWRVRADDDGVNGAWQYGFFNTAKLSNVPVLIPLNPSNGTWTYLDNPMLSVEENTAEQLIDGYVFELFSDEAGQNLIQSESTSGPQWLVPNVTDRNYYYWQAKRQFSDGTDVNVMPLQKFYVINDGTPDIPYFEFVSLQLPETVVGTEFNIQWLDEYDGGDATINLYYDNDNTGEDGVMITSGLSENDWQDQYRWDLSGLPQGEYYLYAQITTESDQVVVYSPSSLTYAAVGVVLSADGNTTSETGDTVVVSVNLDTAPDDYVVIDIQSSDETEAVVLPNRLVFTPSQWNQAQEVTVTGVDDMINDGNQTYQLSMQAINSNDLNYKEVVIQPMQLENIDDGLFDSLVDISMTKNLITLAPYLVNEEIVYELIITNNGPDEATEVLVEDSMQNLSLINVSDVGCFPLGVFPCTIDSIAPKTSVTMIVTTALTDSGAFDNEASAFASQKDSNELNNVDNSDNGGVSSGANLSVEISNCYSELGPDQSVSYQIRIVNDGDLDVNNAILDVSMSPLLELNGWTCESMNGASCDQNAGSGEPDGTLDLPIGSSIRFSVDSRVQGIFGQEIINQAEISLPKGMVDVDEKDNSSEDRDSVTDYIFANGFETGVDSCLAL